MVLTVGTVEPRKGIECVVAAAEQLAGRDPRVNFVVVGAAGWAGDDLLNRLRTADAADEIPLRWISNADDHTLAQLYRDASVVLQPSWAEGFGLPIVEAMSAGARVLARDLPVFRELMADDASFFHLNSQLVPALLERLADPTPSRPTRPRRTWADAAEEILDIAGFSIVTPRD